MAALGSEHVSLKGDTDEGHVELAIGDSTYTRTLSWTDDATGPTSISTGGEPYVKDADSPISSPFSWKPTKHAKPSPAATTSAS